MTHVHLPSVHVRARLTARDVRRLIRVIGDYQDHLESCIDSEVIDAERWPRDPARRPVVAFIRRQWREAESLVKILSDLRA